MPVCRMRTVSEAARMLRADDPGTAVTPNALRSMVLRGEVPHVRVGTKRLVNYDQLCEMLRNPPACGCEQAEAVYGKIRQVQAG